MSEIKDTEALFQAMINEYESQNKFHHLDKLIACRFIEIVIGRVNVSEYILKYGGK